MAGHSPEMRKFAEQVVEVYASRVALNLLAQGQLERAVLARIAGTGDHAPERAQLANDAIAEWEAVSKTRGPRITVVGSGRVVEKRPAW